MTTLDFSGICKPTEEFIKLKEENLKLKQWFAIYGGKS